LSALKKKLESEAWTGFFGAGFACVFITGSFVLCVIGVTRKAHFDDGFAAWACDGTLRVPFVRAIVLVGGVAAGALRIVK
jgi:hypothetical protein